MRGQAWKRLWDLKHLEPSFLSCLSIIHPPFLRIENHVRFRSRKPLDEFSTIKLTQCYLFFLLKRQASDYKFLQGEERIEDELCLSVFGVNRLAKLMVWRVFVSPVGVTKNLLARPALVRMKRKQMVLALAIMDVSPPFFYRDHEDWNPQLLDNSITIAPSRSYWLFFFSPFHIVFSLTPFYLFFVTENLFPNVNVFHPNCFNKVDFLFELENESKRWTMCLQRWLPSCIFQHLLSFDNFCANEGATFVNLTKFDLCWQMAEWPLEAQLWFTPRGNDQHLSQVLLTWTYDSSS